MAGVGQKYGISGSAAAGWTFGGPLDMPNGTLNQESAAAAIVAGTTRTQAGATALVNEINRIDTSTASGAGLACDGVILPASAAGLELVVHNNTANPVRVYAQGSDTLNGVAGATGVVMPARSVHGFACAAPGAWAVDLGVGYAGQLPTQLAQSAITAGTTRTQAGATALVAAINRVDTSTAPAAGATLGDGVVLPASAAGLEALVWNNTANNIQVYAAGSDTINGVAGATGVILPPGGLYIFACAVAGAWCCDGVGAGASGAFPTVTAVVGLTAFAGGGQGSATAVATQLARFDTVASAGDSAKLPAGKAGMQIVVANNGAAAMNVFPATGEQINTAGANVAFALPSGKTAAFNCMANGAWHAVLSA
jgi:hypothetical protein